MSEPTRDEYDAAILIVEDHRETRTFLNLALSDGYRVDCAEDATTALQMSRETDYDLLLIDIALQDNIDGMELAERLRERPEYHRTPMIGMTAHQVGDDHSRFLDRGFDAFLPKPFFPEDLLELIRRKLEGRADGGPERRV